VTTAAEAAAAVHAWNNQYKQHAIPVIVDGRDEPDEIEFTDSGAFLSGAPQDEQRTALIRLIGRHYRGIELSRIAPHPLAAEMAGLPDLGKTPELDFPPPDCAYCEIGLYHDGDGFACEQCGASWASDGYSHHTRKCVEDRCRGAEAQVLGADGQPRCRPCAFLILTEVIEPTGPYDCKRSYCLHGKVYGMPYNSPARRNQQCGRHQASDNLDARLASYRSGS
jgi:hypothetical protein